MRIDKNKYVQHRTQSGGFQAHLKLTFQRAAMTSSAVLLTRRDGGLLYVFLVFRDHEAKVKKCLSMVSALKTQE